MRNQRSNVTRGITDKERALVDAIVTAAESGAELTREEAGTLAGYGTGEVARVQASRALAREPVRNALVERMRELAVMDAPAALATLRHVRREGALGHRLTAAVETLKLAGIGQAEPGGGGGIMVAFVGMPPDIAARLAQHAPRLPQVMEGEAEPEGEDHRDEVAVARRGRRAPAATPPRGAPRAAAKRGGGGPKRPRARPARGTHTISPSSGSVSGGETP